MSREVRGVESGSGQSVDGPVRPPSTKATTPPMTPGDFPEPRAMTDLDRVMLSTFALLTRPEVSDLSPASALAGPHHSSPEWVCR